MFTSQRIYAALLLTLLLGQIESANSVDAMEQKQNINGLHE